MSSVCISIDKTTCKPSGRWDMKKKMFLCLLQVGVPCSYLAAIHGCSSYQNTLEQTMQLTISQLMLLIWLHTIFHIYTCRLQQFLYTKEFLLLDPYEAETVHGWVDLSLVNQPEMLEKAGHSTNFPVSIQEG
jgi:hypothetical protein